MTAYLAVVFHLSQLFNQFVPIVLFFGTLKSRIYGLNKTDIYRYLRPSDQKNKKRCPFWVPTWYAAVRAVAKGLKRW